MATSPQEIQLYFLKTCMYFTFGIPLNTLALYWDIPPKVMCDRLVGDFVLGGTMPTTKEHKRLRQNSEGIPCKLHLNQFVSKDRILI